MIILCVFNFRPFNDVLQKWYSLIQTFSCSFVSFIHSNDLLCSVRLLLSRACKICHTSYSLFVVYRKRERWLHRLLISFCVCFYRPFSLALFFCLYYCLKIKIEKHLLLSRLSMALTKTQVRSSE